MPRLKAGTESEGPLLYTKEQLETLETLKHEGLRLGAARAEYVNHVLAPDGSVSSETGSMQASVREIMADLLAGDTSDPELLAAATSLAIKGKEIEAHIAENRFLFVVSENCIPLIYFQCAVPGNPDVEEMNPAPAESGASSPAPAEG